MFMPMLSPGLAESWRLWCISTVNIKGLEKNNMPRTGDVMVYKKDSSLSACADFDAQIQVLDIPGEIKVGYSPIGFVRCGRAACRVTKVLWKIGEERGRDRERDRHRDRDRHRERGRRDDDRDRRRDHSR